VSNFPRERPTTGPVLKTAALQGRAQRLVIDMAKLRIGMVALAAVVVLGGCVAAECRDGSHKEGGDCVPNAAGEGGASGTGGDAGTAGSAGEGGMGGTAGDDDGGTELDAGADAASDAQLGIDANVPMMCDAGYSLDLLGVCVDDDECLSNPCGDNATCVNTPGMFECSCNTGFLGDGTTCADINECDTNNGGCDVLTTCTNTPGNRTCGACPSGYLGNGDDGCMDINECTSDADDCDANPLAMCSNIPGAFTCACPSGYEGDGHGSNGCSDINECASGNGGCDTSPMVTCTNTEGGRTCGACPSGYMGNGIGANGCADINECATNNGGCDAAATCTNTPGSRTCSACPAGYTGNGSVVDGCAPRLATLGITPGAISPVFAPTTPAYAATAGLMTRYAQVSATTLVSNAAITVAGAATDTYGTSFAWLGTGSATVPVVITDPHGRSSTYQISVTRDGSVTQRAYIKAPDGGQYQRVGTRMALDGNTLVAGGYAPGLYGGAVRVFVRNGNSWVYQTTIDGADATGSMSNAFGFSGLDIQGDTLAVGIPNYQRTNYGATGAVFVYRRTGSTWALDATLYASNSEDGDRFGETLAVYGDRVVVSAPGEDSDSRPTVELSNNNNSNSGAAYVFARNAGVWAQEAYLKSSNAGTDDNCTSVDMYRDTILFGCPGEDGSGTGINPGVNNSRSNSGAAYMFRRGSSAWSQLLYVKASASTAAQDAGFGYYVALGTEEHFAVAAPLRSIPMVHVFGPASPGVWAQQAGLTSDTGSDYFGIGLAMWGPGTVVVNAPGDDSNSFGVNATRSDVAERNSGGFHVFLRASETVATFERAYFVKTLNAEPDDTLASSATSMVGVFGDLAAFSAPMEDSSATGVVTPGPNAGSDVDVSTIYDSGALYSFR